MRKLRSQRLRRVPVIPIIVNATPKVRFSLIAESGRETYCSGVEPSETSGEAPEKPAAAAQRPGRERIQNAQYTLPSRERNLFSHRATESRRQGKPCPLETIPAGLAQRFCDLTICASCGSILRTHSPTRPAPSSLPAVTSGFSRCSSAGWCSRSSALSCSRLSGIR